MGNKIYAAVVLLLWVATMSWLLVAKILPPFFQGEPPYLEAIRRDNIVCWQIECGGQPVGWAVSQVVPGVLKTTEILSRVRLEDIPIREMAPQWMGALVNNIGPIQLDMRNRVALDSLGNLATFDTNVELNDMPAVIKLTGRVDESSLRLRFQSGDIVHSADYPAPKSSFLGGELTPDPKLLQMYVGRRWQKEVYSPFRPPSDSVELVQAEVVAEEPILHEGKLVTTRRVEYRTLAGAGVASKDTLRAVVWVSEEGTVLRQDVHLMHVRLRFQRQTDTESLQLAAERLDVETFASARVPTLPHRQLADEVDADSRTPTLAP